MASFGPVKHITWQGVVLGVVLGIVFSQQVRRLPLVDKIPTV